VLTPVVNSKIAAQAVLTLPMAALSYAILTLWVYRATANKDRRSGN
jgi:hypothetical protein